MRALLFAIALAAALPGSAAAHCAPSGWCYPSNCCSDDGRECDPIPYTAVSVVGDKYRIHLKPGDHKNVTKEVIFWRDRTGNANVRRSGDGGYHACISSGAIICGAFSWACSAEIRPKGDRINLNK